MINSISHLSLDSQWLFASEKRLDGSFYLNEGIEALIKIKKIKLKQKNLAII